MLIAFAALLLGWHSFAARASWKYQGNAQPSQAKQPATKGAALVVDTDDACHLFVDSEDKGVITPAASQKFKIGPDEHILKCSVDGIPDLVWRKVVDAKGASQVAAVISLKALHIQYDQTIAKVKSQKAEADAIAQKELNEAEAQEQARKAADAQALQKLFDVVKGEWKVELNNIGRGPASPNWAQILTLKQIENDGIRVIFTFQPTQPSQSYGFAVEGVFKPTSSNTLVNEGHYDSVLCKGTGLRSGAVTDANGWGACSFTLNRSDIKIVAANKIELNLGDHVRTFSR